MGSRSEINVTKKFPLAGLRRSKQILSQTLPQRVSAVRSNPFPDAPKTRGSIVEMPYFDCRSTTRGSAQLIHGCRY